MALKNPHPGVILNELLEQKGISQRELATRLDVAHSQLNNILNGNRAININFALSLQAAGYKDASFWLTKQMEYELSVAQSNQELSKKNQTIEILKEIEELVPIYYFKKQDLLKGDSEDNVREIFKIYDVKDLDGLRHRINNYDLSKFRKSSKFEENKNNVIAWSILAQYFAKNETVAEFDKKNESKLMAELKKCFLTNKNTVKNTKKILNKYGIKFFILDRPSQTPVDGKSFMCGNNPTIVLTLKYNRLDNFAFTIMHELGHVFEHLTKSKYKNVEFYINPTNVVLEELEADIYAKDVLIDPEIWDEFIFSIDEYDDDIIFDLAKKIKVHPGIIRGRICFENPEYYRKRTSINAMNVLQ
jgi:HTH-type transcriptional regulator/antitoxin HigA